MTNNNQDNQPHRSGFSLQGEIRKRKSEEITRAVENNQLEKVRGNTGPLNQLPQLNVPSPDPRRATQQANAVERKSVQRQSSQRAFSGKQKRLIVGLLGALGLVVICALTVLLALSTQQPVQAAFDVASPLPKQDARDVVAYLKTAGVDITNVRELANPEEWQSTRLLEVEVKSGDEKGLFLLLSYNSQDEAVADTFRAKESPRFKAWARRNMSNVNVLISPETSAVIRQMIFSHLTSFIVAPYRSFLDTPTPQIATTSP